MFPNNLFQQKIDFIQLWSYNINTALASWRGNLELVHKWSFERLNTERKKAILQNQTQWTPKISVSQVLEDSQLYCFASSTLNNKMTPNCKKRKKMETTPVNCQNKIEPLHLRKGVRPQTSIAIQAPTNTKTLSPRERESLPRKHTGI